MQLRVRTVSDETMKVQIVVNTKGILMAIPVFPFSITTYYHALQESSSFPHCLYALIGLNDLPAPFKIWKCRIFEI